METREHRMDAEMNIMEPSALAWDHWGFSDEEVAGGNGQSSEIRWERKVENDRIRKETKGMQMTNIPYAIIFSMGSGPQNFSSGPQLKFFSRGTSYPVTLRSRLMDGSYYFQAL